MAGDVKIAYGSTGFEKVNLELATLEKTGTNAGSWFRPLQKTLVEAETAGASFTQRFGSDLKSIESVVSGVVGGFAKMTAGITAIAGIAGGLGVSAFAAWGGSVLKTTENFRMLETSLYGALKSWDSVRKVSTFAMEYAAEYPAMYKDVMQAMQSFSFIPALKPMIERGDVKQMKEMMDIIQGFMTMRPEQGVTGAMFALREALAGQWRSLQMRFDIPVESIARSAGMTMAQMKASPQEAIKALKSFMNEFVGVETMAMMAKNLSNQVGNLKDKYETWLGTLGKSGVYDRVVGYIIRLNDVFDALLKSERFEKISAQINLFLEKIVDRIAAIFTKGINWEGITDFEGLLAVFRKIGQNSMDTLREAWEAAKGPISEALKSVLTLGAQVAIDAAKDLFFPVGKSIANGIASGLEQGMKEHPFLTMLMGGGIGAYLTPGGPLAKLIGGVAGMEAVALPTQIKTVKSLWENYREYMEEELPVKLGLKEKKTMPFVAAPWTGPRPWQKIEEAVTPPQPGWIQEWVKSYVPKVTRPWAMDAEEKFAQYGMWSRMAGQLAAAGEEPERKTAWSRYIGGEIDWETMRRQEKLETFRGQQMVRLEEIVGMPEAGPEIKSKAFAEMFTVSMARGEFGQAQKFMNQSLDQMVQAMKEQAGIAQKDSENLNNIAGNTSEMVSLLKSKEPSQSRSITPRYDTDLRDEILYDVRRNRYTND